MGLPYQGDALNHSCVLPAWSSGALCRRTLFWLCCIQNAFTVFTKPELDLVTLCILPVITPTNSHPFKVGDFFSCYWISHTHKKIYLHWKPLVLERVSNLEGRSDTDISIPILIYFKNLLAYKTKSLFVFPLFWIPTIYFSLYFDLILHTARKTFRAGWDEEQKALSWEIFCYLL